METQSAPLIFSEFPGCRERHLLRKYNNPLFLRAQHPVTQFDIDQAISDDLIEYEEFVQKFNQLLLEVSKLEDRDKRSDESDLSAGKVIELKERIDYMYDQCAGFGQETSAYKQVLGKLYDTIISAVSEAVYDDSETTIELEKEKQARELHMNLIEYTIVCDLLRPDSPIEDNELVPTLLSEDAESVQVVMSLFENEQQIIIRDEARILLDRLISEVPPSSPVLAAYGAMMKQKQ